MINKKNNNMKLSIEMDLQTEEFGIYQSLDDGQGFLWSFTSEEFQGKIPYKEDKVEALMRDTTIDEAFLQQFRDAGHPMVMGAESNVQLTINKEPFQNNKQTYKIFANDVFVDEIAFHISKETGYQELEESVISQMKDEHFDWNFYLYCIPELLDASETDTRYLELVQAILGVDELQDVLLSELQHSFIMEKLNTEYQTYIDAQGREGILDNITRIFFYTEFLQNLNDMELYEDGKELMLHYYTDNDDFMSAMYSEWLEIDLPIINGVDFVVEEMKDTYLEQDEMEM